MGHIKCLVFASVLAVPAIIGIAPSLEAQAVVQFRVYDRDHRDYHQWNEREDRAYRSYYAEQRRERQYRVYRSLNRSEQRSYWRWRHEHPDVAERR